MSIPRWCYSGRDQRIYDMGRSSGVLTLSGSVSVADGTRPGNTCFVGDRVVDNASVGPGNVSLLTATQLTMSCLLDLVARLRVNAIPEIDVPTTAILIPSPPVSCFPTQISSSCFRAPLR